MGQSKQYIVLIEAKVCGGWGDPRFETKLEEMMEAYGEMATNQLCSVERCHMHLFLSFFKKEKASHQFCIFIETTIFYNELVHVNIQLSININIRGNF